MAPSGRRGARARDEGGRSALAVDTAGHRAVTSPANGTARLLATISCAARFVDEIARQRHVCPRGHDFAGLGVVLVRHGARGRAGAPGDGLGYHRRAMMDRRRFLCTLSAGLLAASGAGEAQQAPARLVMLLTGPPSGTAPEYAAFTKQLGDFGWIEGRNLTIDRRWADAAEKFLALAADALREKPTVILTAGPDATRAARQATSTIPIVMIASTIRASWASRAWPVPVAI